MDAFAVGLVAKSLLVAQIPLCKVFCAHSWTMQQEGGWVGQVLLCTRERKFGRFSRILLEEPSCFQSNSELNLHLASAKMFDSAHSHENHWEKKTAWIVNPKRKEWIYVFLLSIFICLHLSSKYLWAKQMSFTGLKKIINIFAWAVVMKISATWGLTCATKDIWLCP